VRPRGKRFLKMKPAGQSIINPAPLAGGVMEEFSGFLTSEAVPPLAPKLVIEWEPGYRAFLRNLVDVLFPFRSAQQANVAEPGWLWSHVSVASGLPWTSLVGSFALHILVLAGAWAASRAFLLRPYAIPQTALNHADVIYYSPSEYLPSINTGNTAARNRQKGDPEFARQPIISVPPESDNRAQTIVTPPDIKLKQDLPLPNIVAWNSVAPSVPLDATSRLQRTAPEQHIPVITPAPSIKQAADRRRLDSPELSAIVPAPEVVSATSRHKLTAPEVAVVEPPPVVKGQVRQIGDINVGQSEVIAPAPALPVGERRALSGSRTWDSTLTTEVVPPPPSTQGTGTRRLPPGGLQSGNAAVPPPPSIRGVGGGSNRIIALGIHPGGSPPIAAGNRRGTFAATPQGKSGSSAKPEIADVREGTSSEAGGGHGGAGALNTADKIPPGLMVGAPPHSANPGNAAAPGTLTAHAISPRVSGPSHPAEISEAPRTDVERQVFGERKLYLMLLNMPNLNSAGGSWIIRFAELKDRETAGDLTAPELTRKVDPAYPLELIRTSIEGKVTLYAVIHSDGHVGDVRVLNSVDERLDSYAGNALARWLFRPATKNGTPIAVEAVVTIPFRAGKTF
jgi:TonB family protein